MVYERAEFERRGLTPWQVGHGSLAANHAWHRNGARGVPGQYKPASTQAGDTATVYGGEGNLARLAVTLRTASMLRSISDIAFIGSGSRISDRGDGGPLALGTNFAQLVGSGDKRRG